MSSLRLLLYCCTATLLIRSPLYAQHIDSLLMELAGPDVDRVESELGDDKKKKKPPSPLSSAEIASLEQDDDFAPQQNIKTNGVTLQGLDKTTGRVFIIDAAINQPIEFGTLKIVVQHCEKAPPESREESKAVIKITEEKNNGPLQLLFSGWMYSSSPALSCLDHPMYDVWIKECKDLKK